ncbi:MAG: LysR family transcriptional regulator [Proteobacteria bacterium]|nr:MAG: LysR family transcriptional regulator [Pseudomonadota bacterium]
MQELSWDDLKVLLACSRHGSTRSAAAALGVSNSTIARRLEVLEAAIEGRLFDRTPDGLLATTLCEELLPVAKTVEDTISDGQLRLTGRDALLAGKLKVSIADFQPMNRLLFEKLSEFSKTYPRIQLDVKSSNENVDLSRREADFAIRGLKISQRPPKDIVGVKLGLLSIGLYVHKKLLSDARLGRRELTFIDTADVLPAELPTHSQLGIKIKHSVDGVISRVDAVANQMGVAPLPCCTVTDLKDVVRLPNTDSVPYRYVWLLYHKDLRQSARIRALFKHLLQLEDSWPPEWAGQQPRDVQPSKKSNKTS